MITPCSLRMVWVLGPLPTATLLYVLWKGEACSAQPAAVGTYQGPREADPYP